MRGRPSAVWGLRRREAERASGQAQSPAPPSPWCRPAAICHCSSQGVAQQHCATVSTVGSTGVKGASAYVGRLWSSDRHESRLPSLSRFRSFFSFFSFLDFFVALGFFLLFSSSSFSLSSLAPSSRPLLRLSSLLSSPSAPCTLSSSPGAYARRVVCVSSVGNSQVKEGGRGM